MILCGFSQMPGAGGQQANIGHIYGKVIDSTDKAIGDVSVILLQNKFDAKLKKNKEVLLKGMTTKNNGEFSLDGLPMFGKLKLKITATGYVPYEQEVSFQMNMGGGGGAKPGGDASQQMGNLSKALNAIDKDLGNIKLQADVKQLQGVVVTASKPLMTLDIDKKTFNVDKNIVTAGGTAVDVMRNVPSVQVDIDGNVKLRNAAPQIYIDGRPTTLSLDQIPADAIESVEVITNPSAKYDASGGNAGILNIVLKKNKKTGYNGNLMAGIDRRGGWNGGGNFNLRQEKFNFSAALMSNQMRNRTTGSTNRYDYGDTAVNIDDIVVTEAANKNDVSFALTLTQAPTLLQIPVDLDLIMPGLQMKINALAQVSFGFSLPLSFGIDARAGRCAGPPRSRRPARASSASPRPPPGRRGAPAGCPRRSRRGRRPRAAGRSPRASTTRGPPRPRARASRRARAPRTGARR